MAGAALLVGNPVEDSSSDVKQAVQQAKANQERLQNSKPLETLPLPKTFSSTSVIRDAIEPFASGAFGVIWKGRAIIPGTAKSQWPVIVLKEIDSNEMAQDEIEAMRRIGPHPHLVELLGVYETNRKVVHLVLEFIDGPGDLHTIVCERNFLSVELCQWIAAQIGSAIQHIHSQGWVFGDIKPENILLTNDGQAKLCDFGACFISGKEKVGGTIEYLPPEQVPSFQGDWWSFGCVLHFMLTGKPPVFFNKVEEMDLTSAFARAVTFADQRGGMWIKDSQARNLVAMLCDRDPKLRPKDGGESHQFFSKLRPWEGLFKSRREEMPKLPKALKSSSSATTSASSPWQRRTFSMMHSPLPKAYKVLDAGFLSSCIVKGRIIPEVEWTSFSNSSLGQMFTEEREAIPKSRIAVVATVQQNQGGKSRKVVKANYSVGGIDLTAG